MFFIYLNPTKNQPKSIPGIRHEFSVRMSARQYRSRCRSNEERKRMIDRGTNLGGHIEVCPAKWFVEIRLGRHAEIGDLDVDWAAI